MPLQTRQYAECPAQIAFPARRGDARSNERGWRRRAGGTAVRDHAAAFRLARALGVEDFFRHGGGAADGRRRRGQASGVCRPVEGRSDSRRGRGQITAGYGGGRAPIHSGAIDCTVQV